MEHVYMESLKNTFRKMDKNDEGLIQEQINVMREAVQGMKRTLQDIKTAEDAKQKIKWTVNGITDFTGNYAKIELISFDTINQAKHLSKCLEFVLNQLDGMTKKPKDLSYESLVTAILNLDGVARSFAAKAAKMEPEVGARPASRESGNEINVSPQKRGKAEENRTSIYTTDVTQQDEPLRKENREMVDQRKLKEKIKSLENENAELTKKLQTESDAKNDALQRLSKLAGDKMKVGNPDLADLSDPNRPLKLADEFSELYSNEWTDALEYLQKKATKGRSAFAGGHTIHVSGRQLELQEKGSIDLLLDTLKICYQISKEEAESQQKTILNALTGNLDTADVQRKVDMENKRTPGVGSKTVGHYSQLSQSPENLRRLQGKEKDILLKSINDTHSTLSKAVWEFQRSLGTQTVKIIPKIISTTAIRKIRDRYKELYRENEHNNYGVDKFLIYVEKCSRVCWLMRIQFPPVYLEFDITRAFDGKFWIPYLNSGDMVQFPVWPAMYLHQDNGALIRKGVVEYTRKN